MYFSLPRTPLCTAAGTACSHGKPGAILVFMPGIAEIKRAIRTMEQFTRDEQFEERRKTP